MAHFWTKIDDEWAVVPLNFLRLVLTGERSAPVRRPGVDGDPGVGVVLSLDGEPGRGLDNAWALFPRDAASIQVNGYPVTTGLQVLQHQDEVLAGWASRLYFCADRTAQVVPFPGVGGKIKCPRCRQEIEQGTPAVKCPSVTCGLWHHQDPGRELECWTYDDKCSHCPQETALDAGYSWIPGDL